MRTARHADGWNRFNPSQEAEARGIKLNGTTAEESDEHGVPAIALQPSGAQQVCRFPAALHCTTHAWTCGDPTLPHRATPTTEGSAG